MSDEIEQSARPLEFWTATAAANEALDGLLAFTQRVGGRFSANAGASYGWQVAVEWHSIGEGHRRVFGEDRDFVAACVLCRGLLAHAISSGVAS